MINTNKIFKQGLWQQNPAMVQLLGLCPLLAVTTTFYSALGLGLATLVALLCSNTTIALLRKKIPQDLRMPVFVVIIAGSVTLIQILLQSYAFGLYQSMGIFLALITTNCTIMARAESFAYKNSTPQAVFDALAQGIGFLLVLLLMGSIRQILGQQALLAILPPGAFILFGLLLALRAYVLDSNTHSS